MASVWTKKPPRLLPRTVGLILAAFFVPLFFVPPLAAAELEPVPPISDEARPFEPSIERVPEDELVPPDFDVPDGIFALDPILPRLT